MFLMGEAKLEKDVIQNENSASVYSRCCAGLRRRTFCTSLIDLAKMS